RGGLGQDPGTQALNPGRARSRRSSRMSDASRPSLRSRMIRFTVRLALAWIGVAALSSAAAAIESDGIDFTFLSAPGTASPRLLRKVAPIYPPLARQDGIAGTVIVWARVGRDGRVR